MKTTEQQQNELYPPEYRRTRCLRCGQPLKSHRRLTAADIEASQGATYHKPVNGYRAPLHPSLIGQWQYHDPMPWEAPKDWETRSDF